MNKPPEIASLDDINYDHSYGLQCESYAAQFAHIDSVYRGYKANAKEHYSEAIRKLEIAKAFFEAEIERLV